jgi:hypothetical protein
MCWRPRDLSRRVESSMKPRIAALQPVLGSPRVVVLACSTAFAKSIFRQPDDSVRWHRTIGTGTYVYSAQACTLSVSFAPIRDSIQAQAMSIPAETPEAVQNLLEWTYRALGTHSTPCSAVASCDAMQRQRWPISNRNFTSEQRMRRGIDRLCIR